MISPLAYVDPSAQIGENVTIHPFAYIDKNVVIGNDNVIMPYASILSGARIGKGNTIYQGAVIAATPQDFTYTGEDSIAVIGDGNIIRENAVITRATHADGETRVGNESFIMQGVRLSHDAKVGNHCIVGNGSQVSGHAVIDDYSILASNVLMQGHTHLGSWSIVQGGCRFHKDIPPYIIIAHEPAAFYSINKTVMQSKGFSDVTIKHIAHAYRIIYQSNTTTFDALHRIEQQIPMSTEIQNIIEFIRESELKLGIIK
jgi:UDP-N-acetylglucosamine acyltransferase